MTKHPTQDWEWDDCAEEGFVEWFNGDYGSPYSLRSEYFFGDCLIGDEKTRQNMMYKYLHSAYVNGYNMGRLSETKVGLTNND
jgi:hypothetical protein